MAHGKGLSGHDTVQCNGLEEVGLVHSGQHQGDANYDFFMEKMHAAFAFADQKIQAMKG